MVFARRDFSQPPVPTQAQPQPDVHPASGPPVAAPQVAVASPAAASPAAASPAAASLAAASPSATAAVPMAAGPRAMPAVARVGSSGQLLLAAAPTAAAPPQQLALPALEPPVPQRTLSALPSALQSPLQSPAPLAAGGKAASDPATSGREVSQRSRAALAAFTSVAVSGAPLGEVAQAATSPPPPPPPPPSRLYQPSAAVLPDLLPLEFSTGELERVFDRAAPLEAPQAAAPTSSLPHPPPSASFAAAFASH